MALDEPTEKDTKHEEDGLSVCIDSELLEQLGGVVVDFHQSMYAGSGFSVRPAKKQATDCSNSGCAC